MERIRYQIQLSGRRHSYPGSLSLTWEEPRVYGSMTIMGKSEPVDGVVKPDGQCRLHTRRVALNRVHHYVGKGSLTREEVSLSLEGGRIPITIKGQAEGAVQA